jgi:hypothetical protein
MRRKPTGAASARTESSASGLLGALFVLFCLAMVVGAVGAVLKLTNVLPRSAQLPAINLAPEKKSFDGEKSFALLKKQVEFGPRVPNTQGHIACREWMLATLKPLADAVERQDFAVKGRGTNLRMTNVLARFKGTGAGVEKSVVLAAHWDTRPSADYERTPENRNKPIPGANDGASGVAVLLELARQFKASRPPVPVMLVFLDGEDVGPNIDMMFLGSRYLVKNKPQEMPTRGILLDMIGDKELVIPQEINSITGAKEVVAEVYGVAKKLGYSKQFPAEVGQEVIDDHVQLQEAGIKMIDLIDFDYGPGHSWWHTLADTPDKCSAASLQAVGDVVLDWVRSQN